MSDNKGEGSTKKLGAPKVELPYEDIKNDLINTDLTIKQIAEKYFVSKSAMEKFITANKLRLRLKRGKRG